ncbi:hypothetical protein ACWEJZ_04820 [Streptomyces bacillaris]|uniref:hypothetical protein n=1 Tax=Streptomyces sp. S8 TaxID=1837283 RepID=UPI000A091E2E|nr:hypothetical protein [Streptomyces sp. S8]ARI54672.1 hypothetical protein A6E92_22710 [Streptomyces sp. S8]
MGGENHYYLTDALGSVVALADEAGTKVNTYAYSPRGVQRAGTSEQIPQPYRFAGGTPAERENRAPGGALAGLVGPLGSAVFG